MPTIGAKVTQEELDAIVEHANQHGITISNLIKHAILREIGSSTHMQQNDGSNNEKEEPHIATPQPILRELITSQKQHLQHETNTLKKREPAGSLRELLFSQK
jgi:hypothetical protein